MTITSKAPYFLLSAAFLAIAWVIVRSSSFYSEQVKQGAAGRYDTLDGLRGFLALGVFFHHSVISFFYYATGKWDVPPSSFYTLTGQVGVSLFFMITGFLFAGKLLKTGGQLNIKQFYISRIRRIVPMYAFSFMVVLLIIACLTHFHRAVGTHDLMQQIASWGMFGLQGLPDTNGLKNTAVIESVYWTLRYEWLFYLVIPFLALFAVGKRFFVCLGAVLIYCIVFRDYYTINFTLGALAAWLLRVEWLRQICRKKISAFIPLFALVLVFLRYDTSYQLKPSIFLFVFFVFVVQGNSLFGLLKMRAASYLGVISYSVYLVHSLVLFAALRTLNHFRPVTSLQPAVYWVLIGLVGMTVIAISAVTYRYIEYRFYHMSSAGDRPGIAAQPA